MHLIESVEVEGFWDTHTFTFKPFADVTFLIGPNGTGKTTLINLLAAALTADFRTLDRIPFKKIGINLTGGKKGQAPRILVQKLRKKRGGYRNIDYKIRESHGTEMSFSLDDVEEQLFAQRLMHERYVQDYYRRMSGGVIKALRDLVSVTWLSVHRTPSIVERSREERSFESAVDQKLENQSNELVRYFATLSGMKDAEVRQFQESIFVSLLDQYQNVQLIDYSTLGRIDEYEGVLENIFAELHVDQQKAVSLISSYISRARSIAADAAEQADATVPVAINDAMILVGLKRIGAVVERWDQLQAQLQDIFSQRDKYIKITNELLLRKVMDISSSNELQFVSRSGKQLSTQMLSSGEKQLLIL